MDVSRRDFLSSTGVVAGAAVAGRPALKYDLVIANADVLDPAQKLRGKRDIGASLGALVLL